MAVSEWTARAGASRTMWLSPGESVVPGELRSGPGGGGMGSPNCPRALVGHRLHREDRF